MVKVFLEESVELCITRLNTLIKGENRYKVLCPSEAFIKKLLAFYPHLATANLTTLSQLERELGNGFVPTEVAHIFPNFNLFCDPIIALMDYLKTLAEPERELVYDWLKREKIWAPKEATGETSRPYGTCLFFGSFSPKIGEELAQRFKPFFEDFIAIKRSFKPFRDVPLNSVKSYSVCNIQQEREYVRNAYNSGTNVIACHPENWLELFPSKHEVQRLQWIDYQEKATLGYLLPYLYTSNYDVEAREASIKALLDAQKCSGREDLLSLKNWLSLQDKTEELPFKLLDWPTEGLLGDFVRLLNASENSWNLPTFLESCPIKFTRRQFFAYLRRNVKHHAFEALIPWEDALYLPIKDGCFLHGVSEEPAHDAQCLSWFQEIEHRGGNLTVVIPELDEKSIPYTPLIPVTKASEVSESLPTESQKSSTFVLPPDCLKLSCKNWERFHVSPIRTWLDAILKAKKFDLIQPNTRARICGEWVHENLEFETQPKDLATWQASIVDKTRKRWQTLEKIFDKNVPVRLQQWHDWTRQLSLQMAQACSDLLDGSWSLQSEYILPKNVEHSGRIDLLATRANEASIVDFKTALDYAFTATKLNQGHGLQLLLYGRALEPYYKSIQLRVINGKCNNLVLDLNEISSNVQTIETWLKTIKGTGTYTDIPEETQDALPLCWQ